MERETLKKIIFVQSELIPFHGNDCYDGKKLAVWRRDRFGERIPHTGTSNIRWKNSINSHLMIDGCWCWMFRWYVTISPGTHSL